MHEFIVAEVKAFVCWLFRKAKEYVDVSIIYTTESKIPLTDQFSEGKDWWLQEKVCWN